MRIFEQLNEQLLDLIRMLTVRIKSHEGVPGQGADRDAFILYRGKAVGIHELVKLLKEVNDDKREGGCAS
jgi:hypothetical protein